jgi:hypothetical protein
MCFVELNHRSSTIQQHLAAMPAKGLKTPSTKKKAKRSREDRDEEKELEARLFGTQKLSKLPSASRALDDTEADTGLGWLQDDEVSSEWSALSCNI